MKRYTTAEAAIILNISESLVRRYCREGRLGTRIGRNFSITQKQLTDFQSAPRPRGPRAKPDNSKSQ